LGGGGESYRRPVFYGKIDAIAASSVPDCVAFASRVTPIAH
jgi:hypothetical protein